MLYVCINIIYFIVKNITKQIQKENCGSTLLFEVWKNRWGSNCHQFNDSNFDATWIFRTS